jgi:enoyl-[acyl-carrier protein] reductase I
MAEAAPLMAGKKGLVMGVANNRSLAWGITRALKEAGAEIAFTYQNDVMAKRVRPLAEGLGSDILLECDVADDASIDHVFSQLGERWGSIDFVVHAIAFSDKNELTGRYLNTSAENFTRTMAISCFSFTSVCRAAQPYMKNGGGIVTLTYAGSERVVPHYNVMGVAKAALECSVRYLAVDLGNDGIRVNAISAGPIRTLASSGIGDFRYILKWNEVNAPLKRNVTIDDVGGAGLYLLSDLSTGVTGEIHHVDCGYNVIGMKAVDAPDISVLIGDGK